MNTVITLSVNQLTDIILAVCAGIITVSSAVSIVFKSLQAMHRSDKIQDDRLEALETDVKLIHERLEAGDKHFESDAKHIKAIEDANAVTQRAILALLSHSINGNDTESLKRAKTELEEYLTEQKK